MKAEDEARGMLGEASTRKTLADALGGIEGFRIADALTTLAGELDRQRRTIIHVAGRIDTRDEAG